MSNISELELQNLRHLIGGFETTHCKLQEYASEAKDPQVKQFFAKGAKSAMENKQQLMKFLGYGGEHDADAGKDNGSRYLSRYQ